jgi:hypothetical protein
MDAPRTKKSVNLIWMSFVDDSVDLFIRIGGSRQPASNNFKFKDSYGLLFDSNIYWLGRQRMLPPQSKPKLQFS